jgi:protocatechuate 4,5-dioxygenase beta chain
MARPVFGAGVPHGPGLPRAVEQAKGASPTGHLFDQVRSRLEAAAPDLIVTVTSDHLVNFFMDNMPTFAVGVVDRADGPHESWRSMPWYEVQGDSGVGRSLVRYGLQADFDVASCEEVRLDHSTLVPLHFLTPRMDIPVLPLFVKGLVRPLPRASRALAFGRMLRQFIEDLPDHRRVALVASGSFSLEVGGPRVGWLDEPWVTEVTHHLHEGKSAALTEGATEQRMAHAGNVAGELLNWIVLQGFVGETRPASLVREPDQGHAFGVWEIQR